MRPFSSYYEEFLLQKIKVKNQIEKIERVMNETDLITGTLIAKKYWRLKIELSYLEDAMALIRG